MSGWTPRRRGLGQAVRGGIALLTLIVLVVGLPIALYRLGGDPLPRHVPSWRHVSTLLLHRDNGAVFLGAVRDLSWIAWAAFTAAVAVEAQAALRGRAAPRLRLGGLQNAASWLVAAAALAFSSRPRCSPARRPPRSLPSRRPGPARQQLVPPVCLRTRAPAPRPPIRQPPR